MATLSGAPTLPTGRLRLRPLRVQDEQAVRAAQSAMSADDFPFALDLAADTEWSSYVAERTRLQRGIDVPPDRVPSTFLVATVDDAIVGRASIRHELNDWLLAFGGHIGYCVLPPFRRQGLATEILRQSLVIARAFGVERVLVTCDESNVASSSVIERCGGVLDADWSHSDEESPKRRYWIA